MPQHLDCLAPRNLVNHLGFEWVIQMMYICLFAETWCDNFVPRRDSKAVAWKKIYFNGTTESSTFPIYAMANHRHMFHCNPEVRCQYGLEDHIKRAVLIRIPRIMEKHEIYDEQEYDPFGIQRILQQVNIHCNAPNPTKVPISFVASSKERTCEGCGITWNRPMPRCIKCKLVRYCSRACQSCTLDET